MSMFARLFGPRRGRNDATASKVARLLDDARAPGTPRELAREEDALLVFHQANAARAAGTGVAARSTRRGLRALVATGGVVVVTSSGLAFAATGHAPWSQPSAPAPSVGQHSGDTEGPTPSSSTTGAHPDTPSAKSGPTHGDGTSDPSATGGDHPSDGPGSTIDATHPVHPTHPSHPTHPVHPTHPTHPTHPVHPTHSAQPTHPTHPSHPTHPAHPAHS